MGKFNNLSLEHCFKRPYSLFQAIGVNKVWQQVLKDRVGIDGVVIGQGLKEWLSIYSPKGGISKFEKSIKDAIKNNPELIEEDIDNLNRRGKNLVVFAKSIKVLKSTSSKKVFSYYRDLFDVMLDYYIDLWVGFYLVEAVGSYFQETLNKYFKGDKLVNAINYYSKPSKKAHVNDISDYFKKEKNLSKRAKYIESNFPWLFSTDPFSPSITKKQIMDYVSSFEIKEGKEYKGAKLPKELDNLVKIYQDILYIKDKKDEYRREAFYIVGKKLAVETAKRFNVGISDLWYISAQEMEMLEKDKDKILKEVEKRKIAYIVKYDKNGTEIFSGEKAIDNFIKEDIFQKTELLKGMNGSGGKIKGIVQIIKSIDDIKSFKKGNVLVAVTTNPDYISAMAKAIAFITDEGSITCHAAIIAREMNKPAVVAVKNATSILKDGDEVLVDANKGIIKIL